MAQNKIPAEITNQAISTLNNKERHIRSVLSINSGYLMFDTTGYSAMAVIISSLNGNPRISIEGSGDGVAWGPVQVKSLSSIPANLTAGAYGTNTFTNGNAVVTYQVNKPSRLIRIAQGSTGNNSHTSVNVILYNGAAECGGDDIRIPNLNAIYYVSPSGGIINTTPVLMFTSPVGSYVNGIFSMQMTNAGITDTEVMIRSNATLGGGSPTVIYREFLKAGQSKDVDFTPALKTVVNQIFEVVLSATATVYVNAQGWVINN